MLTEFRALEKDFTDEFTFVHQLLDAIEQSHAYAHPDRTDLNQKEQPASELPNQLKKILTVKDLPSFREIDSQTLISILLHLEAAPTTAALEIHGEALASASEALHFKSNPLKPFKYLDDKLPTFKGRPNDDFSAWLSKYGSKLFKTSLSLERQPTTVSNKCWRMAATASEKLGPRLIDPWREIKALSSGNGKRKPGTADSRLTVFQ